MGLCLNLTAKTLISHVFTSSRQRLSRYVRKTLSFSKSLELHELVTRWFIVEYNQSLSLNT